MAVPYHYVRWRWSDAIDIDKIADELSTSYNVKPIPDHGWDLELTYHKDFRDRYIIKSDTLTVFLSLFRIVMVQKRAAPFTKKDLELRERMLSLFPKERPTILPWQSNEETPFQIENDTQST